MGMENGKGNDILVYINHIINKNYKWKFSFLVKVHSERYSIPQNMY